ncbi:MAG TPA: energy transducer TonB [Methylotenera sp.]|nr:energy transducer TonB [Methylotenera sp.]
MTTAITQSSTNENTLIWAIICSILLHVLLAVVIPSIKIDPPKKPEVLEVALVSKPEPPPAVSEPEPLPQPEQPKPEPIKPKVEPKPIVKPTPTPSVIKEEPSPVTPPPATQTEVIAVTPKPEAPPSPTPVVPKPVAPTPVEIDTAHKGYGDTLWSAISKHKKYPRIAQTRGWQGEVIVELSLDGNGNMKSKRIIQHSGYDSLDQQALEMVDKALPFPAPPDALRGSSFTIKVPIPFKLEEQ